ncbi:type 1 glutamine amidotransferase [Aquabacter spiritensis]|uniref:GMP synthase-like glutamine amidotransferase n=1 Tax=Aquabacter spiritensis TaxID=933073 RepID=A0A4R3LL38_9HYPH|nr:type 1 glutamine amidotransferase [Aquabacter spiritensis]TCT00229.1 GMP synthase-like glutamine amidotransferase [Aquabacter spiritensis]
MKFLVLQHAPSEHPGRFREFMRQDGIVWDAVELDAGETIPPTDPYDALLAFGGPMDVWEERIHPWLKTEKAVIRDWVAAGRPFLGICLGHQLLAEAMGGRVAKMARPEVGVCPVALTPEGRGAAVFAGLPDNFPTLQWHGAEVTTLPEGATVLARNEACPIQAIQLGPRAFGVQYHVEIESGTVRDWGAIPEYKDALESITGEGGQAQLEAETDDRMDAFKMAAQHLYGNFLRTIRG